MCGQEKLAASVGQKPRFVMCSTGQSSPPRDSCGNAYLTPSRLIPLLGHRVHALEAYCTEMHSSQVTLAFFRKPRRRYAQSKPERHKATRDQAVGILQVESILF